jgi:hypothetical protein
MMRVLFISFITTQAYKLALKLLLTKNEWAILSERSVWVWDVLMPMFCPTPVHRGKIATTLDAWSNEQASFIPEFYFIKTILTINELIFISCKCERARGRRVTVKHL